MKHAVTNIYWGSHVNADTSAHPATRNGWGKITEDLVDMLMSWRHSGFNVFCGSRYRGPAPKGWGLSTLKVRRIQLGDETAMENLAGYIIRASFSQERMTYIPEESGVIYRSKDGKEEKVFDALEWLAAMCSHVPDKGGTDGSILWLLQYNVSRGKREKEDNDELIPSILEPDGSSKPFRRNWARLIQKITSAKCQGKMRIIAFIEDEKVIKKILKHLGLWQIKQKPPQKATSSSKPTECSMDYSVSQLPLSDDWHYVDPQYPETYDA